MPTSKAQQKAVQKYVSEKYDRVMFTMPKGRKELIQNHALAVGQSLNGYIAQAVDERIEREQTIKELTQMSNRDYAKTQP